jgi:UDP-N-acetylmuramoylalanine--D-glutamate ligase
VTKKQIIVIGLGVTGLSCVDFLLKKNEDVIAMDTREHPTLLSEVQKRYPDLTLYLGEKSWPQEVLNNAKALVVSPGVAISHPAIASAKAAGVEVIGDVELFARVNHAPVIAITGSNGKSTVTSLVGEMAKLSGKRVAVIGNIGVPVLSMDFSEPHDLIVMELSSFQLETTSSLKPLAATVLNISPDHMDRYSTLQDYVDAKHRIYHNATYAVINREDPLTENDSLDCQTHRIYFSMNAPQAGEWGLRVENAQLWLAYGEKLLISEKELKLTGKHNLMNALSALALGTSAGLPLEAMLQALREFTGLPHRCQWVADRNEVRWINDSKGTNVGACEAALKGLGEVIPGKIVLILGGDGKGAEFDVLRKPVSEYCRAVILKGQDADKISLALKDCVPAFHVATMEEAVSQASHCAKPGDLVLLSPACASWDQYRDYAHRGAVFMEAVNKI